MMSLRAEIIDYTEAIRINPNNAEAYRERGICHVHLGEYDQAIADCTEALRLNPRDAKASHWRINAYARKGIDIEAQADQATLIQFDPNRKNH